MPNNYPEQFVSLLTAHQSRLYAYVLSLLGDPHLAADVLQETNMVLWRKSETFALGTDFAAWAFHVAYLQVLAGRQRQTRGKMLAGSEALLQQLAAEAERTSAEFEDRLAALETCLQQLPHEHREVLRRKYAGSVSLETLAEQLKLKPNAVGQLLHRLRLKLMSCIAQRLAAEGTP
jgi:RNA polymerase sigma-70 factor (ECF subfamily)